MLQFGTLALQIVFLLPGCALQVRGATRSEGAPPLEHVVERNAADPLLSYSWDGGRSVPLAPGEGELRIPFGELGLAEDTRCYLPMHGPGNEASDGADALPVAFPLAGAGVEVRATGTRWTAGRLGRALAFPTEDARLSLLAQGQPLLGEHWGIEFWIRLPEDREQRTLLSAPGAFKLLMSRDGHCRLSVEGAEPFRLKSRSPFRPGAWNHVGIALEGSSLHQVRFSLNGAHAGKVTDVRLVVDELEFGGFPGALDDLRIGSYAPTSNLFRERATAEPAPGPHELTLTYADRDEHVVLWAGVLTQPVVRGDLWRQGRRDHARVTASGLEWAPAQWTRYRTNNPPLARTTHPTVYVGDHRVFLFCGETRDSNVGGMVNTNDTWIFRSDLGRWTPSRSLLAPPPTCHQSAAYSPDHDVVLYAGGQFLEGDHHVLYDQTWLYHVEEDRWEQRHPGGDPIPPQSDGATVYHAASKRFVQFAGGRSVMTYDPEADRWELLGQANAVRLDGTRADYVPGGSPMAAYHPPTGRIMLFGGAADRTWQDTTAFYDLATNTHTVVPTEVAPPGRVRAGFAYDGRRDRFVMFGGVKDQFSERDGDLWMFLPGSAEWIELDASDSPSPRGGYYHMAYDPELDRFVLLCGRLEPQEFENDAWALHVDETTPGIATYRFDRRGFPALDHWFAEYDAPAGTRVDWRFRSSADGHAWSSWGEGAAEALVAGHPLVEVEVRLSPDGLGHPPRVLAMGFGSGAQPVEASAGAPQRTVTSVPALAR